MSEPRWLLMRRLCAVLVLAVLIGLAGALLVLPVTARLADHQATMAALQGTLGALTRIAASPPPANDGAGEEARALLVSAEQPGMASAVLQGLVGQRIGAAGGTLSSIQVDQVQDEGLVRLVAEVSLAITLEGATRLLHGLETGHPLLVLRRVAIRDPDGGPYGRAENGPNLLEVTLTIEGYWRGEQTGN